MHRARELAAERHAILVGRGRSDARDRAVRVGRRLIDGGRPEERVRRDEVRVQLVEALLAARLQHHIHIGGRVDALVDERVDQRVAAGLLTQEVEEEVRLPVVRL